MNYNLQPSENNGGGGGEVELSYLSLSREEKGAWREEASVLYQKYIYISNKLLYV